MREEAGRLDDAGAPEPERQRALGHRGSDAPA
jgi:hypothetical protein